MDDTQKVETGNADSMSNKGRTKRKKGCVVLLLFFIFFIIFVGASYFLYFRPKLKMMLGEQLNLASNPEREKIQAFYKADSELKEQLIGEIQYPENLSFPPLFVEDDLSEGFPVCGNDRSWIFLLVGTDYRGSDYMYGLADVIRLVRIDFVNPSINMIALPRDLVITMPEGRFSIQSPMKINQAYLTGTEGWGGYAGEGNGAHSLAEAIEYNFGVSSHHYLVVNFEVVKGVIDAIGGVEVELPQAVYDQSLGSFPAGKQTLNGQEALNLMRIRKNYSDDFRVSNQTIVIKAMFRALKSPGMVLKIPTLVNQFSQNVLTDLNPNEIIALANCFITKFDTDAINDRQIPSELLFADQIYIPSLNDISFVYKWSDDVVIYIHNALMGQ